MDRQDRQPVRTAADLERKYNFGKSFAELRGIVTDAQTHAINAEKALEKLELEVSEFKISVNEDYATKSDLSLKADSASLSVYALKEDLTTYATKSDLSLKADSASLSVYALKEDLTTYATKSDLSLKADSASLEVYATKTELDGYATNGSMADTKRDLLAAIDLKLDTDKLISKINMAANEITIRSDNFTLTADGTVECKNGSFDNCTVNGTLTNKGRYGTITTDIGRIWLRSEDELYDAQVIYDCVGFSNPLGGATVGLNLNTGVGYFTCDNALYLEGVPVIITKGYRDEDHQTIFSENETFQKFKYSKKLYATMWVTTDDAFQLKTENSKNLQIYGAGTNNRLQGSWYTSDSIAISSDVNLKNSISDIADSYSAFFDNLRPVNYKYNDGRSQRYHVGFIAQDVDNALQKAGLTRQDFAGLCIADEGTDSEYWGLRYSEFISLNTYEIQKLKARVAELEKKIGA